MIGRQFGLALVESQGRVRRKLSGQTCIYYNCVCECGRRFEASGSNLRQGLTRSCGHCLRGKWKLGTGVDLTGKTFGRGTVLKEAGPKVRPSGVRDRQWLLRCACGETYTVTTGNLTNGTTQSCGCLQRDRAIAASTTHGATVGGRVTTMYQRRAAILQRTGNPNCPAYPDYGGRGIGICKRWRNSQKAFEADLGKEPPFANATLDRIDNDGHYSCGKCDECRQNGWPMNVRWADWHTQAANRRSSKFKPVWVAHRVHIRRVL